MASTSISEQITQEHPDYATLNEACTRYSAVLAAGSDLLSKDYIHRHVFEDKKQYENRVERAFTIPFAKALITRLVNALYADGVLRSGTSLRDIQGMLIDATGTDVPYDQYMRNAAATAIAFGLCHTVVDFSVSEAEIAGSISNPLSNIQSEGQILPILRKFTPMDMTNWIYHPRYGYEAAIFKITKVVDNSEKNWYLYVDYDSIVEYDESGNAQTTWNHTLGYTPVFTLVNPGMTDESEALMESLAGSQIAVTNLCSVIDEISERHAFSQLTCPDDGTFAELAAKESDYLSIYNRFNTPPSEITDGNLSTGLDRVLRKVSQSSVFTFPAGTGQPPSFISPDASQLGTVWDITQRIITTTATNLGIFDAAGNIIKDVAAPYFTSFASTLATHEDRILTTALAYLSGSGSKFDFSVTYPQYQKELNADWMDIADRIASAKWLKEEAKVAIIQGLIDTNVSGIPVADKSQLADAVEIVDELQQQIQLAQATGKAASNTSVPADTQTSSSK